MYKLCKTEPSAQRQRQLEDGLLTAMLSQRYDDISISDLCDQLGVPRKSFYRYFASKDGALHALIDHRLLEYEAYSEQYKHKDGHTSKFLDLPAFFSFWMSQKPLLDAVVRSDLDKVLVERTIEAAHQSHVLEVRVRGVPKDYKEIATTFVVCGLMTTVLRWHKEGFRHSPQEMAEIAHQLLLRPLIPE